MTSRGKSAVRGYETEIEKSREEANWKKVVDLAVQLKQRSPQHESLAHFLMGEGKLEAYLEEFPPVGEGTEPLATERATRALGEAQGLLALATDEAGRRAGVALDAHLLLAKLHYACGSPTDALQHFQHAELDTLTEKELPVRSLRIVAESYAIKGMCVEALSGAGGGSRYKAAERSAEAVRAYELAAELTLLYVQRCGRAAGAVLDAALLRAPALHVRAQHPAQAAQRCRDMLAAVECAASAPLRLTLARQLAELLLRAAAPYRPPALAAKTGPWRPRRYNAPNQFVPVDVCEELVLVLGVGEALAVRDAVLSQSAEFSAARDQSLLNAVSVIDLLALVAPRAGQLCLVLESLERAMKFSFGSAHVWRQRALATAAAAAAGTDGGPGAGAGAGAGAGRDGDVSGPAPAAVRAAGVMARTLPLCPNDAALRLVATTTAYRMGWVEEGIALAAEALRLEEERAGPLLARACLQLGVGHQMRAQRTNCRVEKEAADAEALRLLVRAAQLDAADCSALHRLALQYTRLGLLNEAMDACRGCLRARAECGGGLRLAAALWSCACAGPRGQRALAAARLARHHYPRAAWPLAALASLQLAWEGGDAALGSGRELMQLLSAEGPPAAVDVMDESPRADAGSLRAERALSDACSSVGGGAAAGAGPGGGAGSPAALERAMGWLTLAELCVRLGRLVAAAGCVHEAQALAPYNHRVLYTRGVVAAARLQWHEALSSFQSALAAAPRHVEACVQLGAAYYALGWLRLAEKTLRDAAALQPRRADTWRRLALVLRALGEPAAAADCAAAALRLQPLAPALPL